MQTGSHAVAQGGARYVTPAAQVGHEAGSRHRRDPDAAAAPHQNRRS